MHSEDKPKRYAFYPSKEEEDKINYLSEHFNLDKGSLLYRKIINKLYDYVLSKGSSDFNTLDNKVSHVIRQIEDLHLIHSKTIYFTICNAYDKIDEELKQQFKNPKELFQYVYLKEIKGNSKTIK